jgi:hypothetical protein
MAWVGRHVVSVVIVSAAVLVAAGLVLLRPRYQPPHGQGTSIKLPSKRPALDAAGARGWVWPDGTPGWTPTQRVDGFLVAYFRPSQLAAARRTAARAGLDSHEVRVLASNGVRPFGLLAILAAPTLDQTPTKPCLAALLGSGAPVAWRCPGSTTSPSNIAHSRVLVAAQSYVPPTPRGGKSLFLAGVARGDVYRIALAVDGKRPQTIYRRGQTWGQFTGAADAVQSARLQIYGKRSLVETLQLRLHPGQHRVFR